MKRIAILYCILFMTFISCKEITSMKTLKYVNFETIKLNELSKRNDYICTGSYIYHADTIASNFEVQSKYSLLVIKIDSVSNNYGLKTKENNSYFDVDAHYSVIKGGNFEAYYNMNTLNKLKEIESITLSSDGKIFNGVKNDSIREYHTSFKSLIVNFNNIENARFYIGDINSPVSGDILFYKKDNNLYFLMMLDKDGKNLRKGTLYNYLFDLNNK